jgi:hypothetical protein
MLLQSCQPMPLKPLPKALKAQKQPRPKHRLLLWPRPNRPSLLWRCAAMTVRVKRKPKPLQVEMVVMAAATAVRASGVPVRVATVDLAARVSVAETVLVTAVAVAKAVISAKTGVRVWAMPLSVPSAKPWSVPKCRCANWPHKPMAKR